MAEKKLTIDERKKNLTEQLKQTEALYFKLQGALELIDSLENEKSLAKDEKK